MSQRCEGSSQSPLKLNANLTLASGSRAGMVVTLHSGFYLIGRNAECQIRPKSRSVSRRHCLVRHLEAQLHVLDLDSTAGTYLNGEKMEPRLWYPLQDGDELRCGKLAFAVAATTANVDETCRESAWANADQPAADAAWQAEDIADWMTDFDELEQAERIQGLRQQAVGPAAETNDPAGDGNASSTALADAPPKKTHTNHSSGTARTAPRPKSRSSAAAAWRLPSFSLPSMGLSGGAERWKTILATVLFMAAVIWLIASLFYFGDDNIYQQVKTLDS